LRKDQFEGMVATNGLENSWKDKFEKKYSK